MDDIQVFKNNQFGELRTIIKNGEPWFVVADVCAYFGVTNRSRVMQGVDADDKGGTQMNTPGGMQTVAIVNEAGLYSVLFALQPTKARGVSDKYIEARQKHLHDFKRWITHDVIPTIRKTGGYVANDDLFLATYLPHADEATKMMFTATLEAMRSLNEKIERDKPKVLFAEAVETADDTILIGDLAKLLHQNGVNIGQKRLFNWLRDNGYLIKYGASKNMPTQYSMERGLMEVKERAVTLPNESVRITRTTKITGKGQTFFVNKFLGEKKEGANA